MVVVVSLRVLVTMVVSSSDAVGEGAAGTDEESAGVEAAGADEALPFNILAASASSWQPTMMPSYVVIGSA